MTSAHGKVTLAPTPIEDRDGVAWGWTGMTCAVCDGDGRLTSEEHGTIKCRPCFGTGEIYGPIGPAAGLGLPTDGDFE